MYPHAGEALEDNSVPLPLPLALTLVYPHAGEALEDNSVASHGVGHHRGELLEYQGLVGLLEGDAALLVRVRI